MNTPKMLARAAGLLYLIVVITGIFSLAYVPSQVNIPGNAAATVERIGAHHALYRWGILSSVICYLAFLLLPLVLYRLLHQVGETAARLMVVFVLVSIPISLLNLHHRFDVLSLTGDAPWLAAFSKAQVEAQVMMHQQAYSHGILLLKICWGLWLIPFGLLVIRSGFIPKLLGYLLIVGGISYIIDFTCNTILPGYSEMPIAGHMTKPAALAEIGTCLWLLTVGVWQRKPVVAPGMAK